jgi:hypothetical protein
MLSVLVLLFIANPVANFSHFTAAEHKTLADFVLG